MNRFLLAIAALALLFAPSLANPPAEGTTTRVLIAVDQVLGGDPPTSIVGNLDATFQASPQAGGWLVEGIFKAEGLDLIGQIDANVSGKATAVRGIQTGTMETLQAAKLNVSGGNGRLHVLCAVVVDAAGVVWVQDLHFLHIPHDPGTDGPSTDA